MLIARLLKICIIIYVKQLMIYIFGISKIKKCIRITILKLIFKKINQKNTKNTGNALLLTVTISNMDPKE